METMLLTLVIFGFFYELQSLIEGKKVDNFVSVIYNILFIAFIVNCIFIKEWEMPVYILLIVLISAIGKFEYNQIKLEDYIWFARLDAIFCIGILLLTLNMIYKLI